MNNEPKDGGPAFPTPMREYGKPEFSAPWGMSLRDYFAAKAMQSLVANGGSLGSDQRTAEISYRIADAMISAREHV